MNGSPQSRGHKEWDAETVEQQLYQQPGLQGSKGQGEDTGQPCLSVLPENRAVFLLAISQVSEGDTVR